MVNEKMLREAFRKIKRDMGEIRNEIEKLKEENSYLRMLIEEKMIESKVKKEKIKEAKKTSYSPPPQKNKF